MIVENNPTKLSKYKIVGIFVFALITSFLLLGGFWKFGMVDSNLWGQETEFFLSHNTEEFNFLAGYGHPGGPIIEGAIALHSFINISYEQAAVLCVILLSSIIIAGTCVLCVLLRKNNLWWISTLGILSLNKLYEYATPPTAVAAVSTVLLCLITLYIYENRNEKQFFYLLLWGFVSGFLVATRTDIGVFSSIAFMLFLLISGIEWKKIGLIILEAFIAFSIFDPFMWFMPFQHIKDLIHKITYHYSDFPVTHLYFITILSISALSFISIFISLQFLFFRKKISSPLRAPFIVTLIIMTIVLYLILLTSRIQAERYFLPILFIWEVFLPLLLFHLIGKMEFSFLKTPQNQNKMKTALQISVVGLFYLYHIAFFFQSLSFLKLYTELKY